MTTARITFEGLALMSNEDRAALKELEVLIYRARCDHNRKEVTRLNRQYTVIHNRVAAASNEKNRNFNKIARGF